MSEELLQRLTNVLEKLGAGSVPISVDLWDADMIAAYLKRSSRQVMSRYAPLPDFPRAIRLPSTTGGCGQPLWKATDVIAWAEKYQEKRKTA